MPAAREILVVGHEDEDYEDDFEICSDDDDERRPSDGDTGGDYGCFLQCMEEALDTKESLVMGDSLAVLSLSTTDAAARPTSAAATKQKANNLRKQCEDLFGREKFCQIYNYLREVRFGGGGGDTGTVDEGDVSRELARMWTSGKPSDCYLMEQLIFLDEQLKINDLQL